MRVLLLVASALALAACLLLAIAFLGRQAQPPTATAQRERDLAPAAAEQVLVPTSGEQDARSPQAVELAAEREPTDATAALALSISGTVRVNGSLPSEPITLRLAAIGDVASGVRRLRVAADGRFEFAGLPAGFRGRLLIPYRYRFLQPESRGAFLDVEAPREDLALDLERLRCLTGRLVSAESGEPVRGAGVEASITWSSGSQMRAGVEFEDDRFFVPLVETSEIGRVSLEAWAEGGLRGDFEFTREELPPDLDLGVLALTLGGVANLVVLDPDRLPVPAARVRISGKGGLGAETDPQGRATLQGLPPEATLEVFARGFDPKQLSAPGTADSVEVVLERATWLAILVLDRSGVPKPRARVRILSEQHLFVGSRALMDPLLGQPIRSSFDSSAAGERNHSIEFLADRQGSIELQSIVPGVALTLQVVDELGCPGHEERVAPLQAHEERQLTIRLSREPRSLSARVTDLLGRPLAGATASARGCEDSAIRTSGADGRFEIEGIHAEEVDLRVQRRGYVPASLPRLRLPRSGLAMSIALDPGRDVRVSVVDGQGKPIVAGSVAAWLLGEDRHWNAVRPPDGIHRLIDIPAAELELRLRLAGKEFRQPLPAHLDETVMTVPELGRVEVTREPDSELASVRLGVLLRSVDGGTEQGQHFLATRTAPIEFEAVLPGSYELSFLTWETEGEEARFVSLRPPIRVQVAPGETTRVQLR